MFVTGSTTPSPAMRTMEKFNGLTIIMDEADLPHSETSADWIQMLNTGYKKGFGILRTKMNNGEAEIEVFDGFGPKILNMRGSFPDDATESRCLTWKTSPGQAIRNDIERFISDRDKYNEEALAIRNKLVAFRLKRFSDIKPNYNHEAMRHLPGRLVEITVPMLSISDEPEFQKAIMQFVDEMNEEIIGERTETLAAKVLEGLLRAYYLPDDKALMGHDELLLQVAHVTRQANRVINRENMEASLAGDEEEGGKLKKEMSSGFVGKIIKTDLSLSTQKAKVGSRPKVVVWDKERVKGLVERYGFFELELELIVKAGERKAKNDDGSNTQQPLDL